MKKELTTKQKKNKSRLNQYLLRGSEFISIATPFSILAIVNRNEWFPSAEAGLRIGLGGSLAIALLSITTFLVTKQQEKEDKSTNGYIALIVGWLMTVFILALLRDIIDQIVYIMAFEAIGLAGAFGLDLGSIAFKKKADYYKARLEKANETLDNESAVEEIKQEREKKIRVKVVKK